MGLKEGVENPGFVSEDGKILMKELMESVEKIDKIHVGYTKPEAEYLGKRRGTNSLIPVVVYEEDDEDSEDDEDVLENEWAEQNELMAPDKSVCL